MAKTRVIIVAPEEIHDFFTQQYVVEWDTQVPVETIDAMWDGLNTGSLSTDTEMVIFLDTFMENNIDDLSVAVASFAPAALVMVIYYDINNHTTLTGYVSAKTVGSPVKFYPIDAAGDLGQQIHDAIQDYGQRKTAQSSASHQAEINRELDEEREIIVEESVQDTSNSERGVIIASTSSKGGSGKTTVGLCTASMLYHASRLAFEQGKRERPLKVCIVDMDTRDGQIGFLLGQYHPTALNVFIDADRSAENISQYLIYDERLGVHALLAPKRARTAEYLTPEFYQDIIQKLSTLFDVVVLDTSVNYLDPLLGSVVLPISDAVMFITNLSIGSVYGMNRWMDQITSPIDDGGHGIEKSKIGVVVNQAASDLGIDQELLTHAASGAHLLVAIPLDTLAVVAASNHNRLNDIILGHETISPAYYKLVTQLFPDQNFVAPTDSGSLDKKKRR